MSVFLKMFVQLQYVTTYEKAVYDSDDLFSATLSYIMNEQFANGEACPAAHWRLVKLKKMKAPSKSEQLRFIYSLSLIWNVADLELVKSLSDIEGQNSQFSLPAFVRALECNEVYKTKSLGDLHIWLKILYKHISSYIPVGPRIDLMNFFKNWKFTGSSSVLLQDISVLCVFVKTFPDVSKVERLLQTVVPRLFRVPEKCTMETCFNVLSGSHAIMRLFYNR